MISLLLAPILAFSATPPDQFSHQLWPQLKKELDAMPVFTVANERGQPLEYEIAEKPVAMFYADVKEAQAELKEAQKQYPELQCDLIPVGLGSAYKLSCEGNAVVIPSKSELVSAGAPEGVTPMGQQLPLFACMDIMREEEGKPVLPLFMSFADCDAAVKSATELDEPEGDGPPLEVVGLSLESVVQRLLSVDPSQGVAFSFIASSESQAYIQAYLAS